MSTERDRLVCNASGCFQKIEETAWITCCSHVFCPQHGKEAKLRQSSGTAVCPSCGSRFRDDLDLVERKLNHPVQVRALLLCGFSPEVIMEIANTAIAFWNFQKQQICANLERKVEYLKEAIATTKSHQNQQRSESESKIRRLEQQLVQAHARIKELNESTRRDDARDIHAGCDSGRPSAERCDKKRKIDEFLL